MIDVRGPVVFGVQLLEERHQHCGARQIDTVVDMAMRIGFGSAHERPQRQPVDRPRWIFAAVNVGNQRKILKMSAKAERVAEANTEPGART